MIELYELRNRTAIYGFGNYRIIRYINMHIKLSSGDIVLQIGLNLHLCPYFVCTSSEGSGETVRMIELYELRNRTAIYDFGTFFYVPTALCV